LQRVVGGQDVLDTIAAQPFARPRDSYYDQPFFSVSHHDAAHHTSGKHVSWFAKHVVGHRSSIGAGWSMYAAAYCASYRGSNLSCEILNQ
jgi:hypothetical protein